MLLERWHRRALLALVACVATVALAAAPSWAQAETLTVNDDTTGSGPTGATCAAADFTTIGAAITAAAAGDTILVCAGTYNERPVVNKSLTINGAQAGVDARERDAVLTDESVIQTTDLTGNIISSSANDVTIDGFVIQGVGAEATNGPVGIQTGDANTGSVIQNNIIQNNRIGLDPNGTGGLIENNLITNNNRRGGAPGTGIYTDNGVTDLTVTENEVSNHFNASMNFTASASRRVAGLDVNNNEISGNRILIVNSTDATVNDNVITDSLFSGIQVDNNNQGTTITGNFISGSGASTTAVAAGVRFTTANAPGTGATPSSGVTVSGNNLLDNEIGIEVQRFGATPSDGIADNGLDANFNRIFGNDVGVQNDSTANIDAINNWWGCNEGPDSAAANNCDSVDDTTTGVTDFDPWLVMDINADPTTVNPGGDSDIEVSFDQNSDEAEVAPNFPDGVTVDFTATGGSVNPASDDTEEAIAETVFTANDTEGDASVTGSLDAEAVTADILVVDAENIEGCTIVGTQGDDTLNGTDGDDVICGLGGNDTINGNGGNDIIRGGEGNDTLNGGDGNDTIEGGDGNDRIFGQDGNDTLNGGDGDDRIEGGSGQDTINGGNGEDRLLGQDGSDTINGGANDDVILGGAGQDVLNGGGGNDDINGDIGDDTIQGGAGNDILKGGAGTDRVSGNTGNDTLLSGTGRNDVLLGGDGDDRLNVRDGTPNDRADGGAGRDTCASDRGDIVRNCEVNNSRSAPLQK